MNKRLAAVLIALPLCAAAALPYTFNSGQTISAAEMNANFNYLNSRIDSLASTAPASITAKAGALPGSNQTPAIIVNNSGTSPVEILEATAVASLWQIVCGANTPLDFSSPAPRFVPPGCSLQVRSVNGFNPSLGYVVTYRQ